MAVCPAKVQTIVVADNVLLAELLLEWVKNQPDLEISGCHPSVAELNLSNPEWVTVERLIIIDVDPTDSHGIGLLLDGLEKPHRRVALIILSDHPNLVEPHRVHNRFSQGWALLRKGRTTIQLLRKATDAALAGLIMIEPMTDSVLPPILGGLSEIEYEVLRFASQGLTNPAIAEAVFTSVKSVERHLSSIYQKLGVDDGSVGLNARVAATLAFHGLWPR